MRNVFMLALILCLGLASTGFAKTYTAEELAEYTQGEIEAMGDKNIDLQIAYWEWRLAEAQPLVEEWEAKVQPLRNAVAILDARINELRARINELRAEISRLRNAGVLHTIVEGECLWKIASYHYYLNDGTKWPLIYERNRDSISDPNLIYAGHTLWVPVPMVSSYTVVDGDYLGKIAGYGVVYGNRGMWPQLYEGNRDKISNPNLIYPGQVLAVPRTAGRGGSSY
jgi:nucleoid-associated protein YgaU